MYPSTITNVRFSVVPSKAQTSNIIVKTRDLLKNNKPAPDGVYSAKQGTTDNNYNCETCFNNKKQCLGHTAIIELPYPMLSPTILLEYKKWIKLLCFKCGNILMAKSDIEAFPMGERMDRTLKQIKAKTTAIKLCAHCNEPYPKIMKDTKDSNFFKLFIGDKYETIMPHMLEELFDKVSNEAVLLMGRPLSSHPMNFIRRKIEVSPPQTRPEVIKLGSNVKSTVDEHTSIYQLLVEKLNDLIITDGLINEKKQTKIMEYNSIYQNLLKGKENSSIAMRFMGKKGLFRKYMMGKRIRVCCRGVIANSTDIKIDELAVPLLNAKTIQFREIVQEYNKDILMRYVRNGLDGYPGASAIMRRGKKYSLGGSSEMKLEIGDIVYRDMIDGDPSPFCRQPSLMISNISTHKIRVLRDPKSKLFQINAAICPFYNADFDGDEMNQFICTSLLGRNEAQKLTSVQNWVISHATSNPLIGQMEDSIIGLVKLTKANLRLDKYHVCSLFRKTTFIPDLSHMKPTDTMSGHEVISILLKDTPINFSRSTQWYVETYKQWMTFNENDMRVEIERGVMKRGILDWASVGKGNNGSIYHIIHSEYGEVKMLEVMYNMQQVGIAYLAIDCLSVGLCDMILPTETKKEISMLSADIINRANEGTLELERGNVIPPIGDTIESFYEKQQTEILTISDLFYPAVLSSIDTENNGLYMMIACKSKGKLADMLGMISAVGQRTINGARAKEDFGYKRTLPYFPRFDTDPFSRGYVGNAYIDGITKCEYFFGAVQVRFDIIVKALSTSITGDQNRQSIKNLESIIINNYRWATKRDNIIQFAYGDDYLDPRRLVKVRFETVKLSDKALQERYFHPDFPLFYAAIVLDRQTYREAFLKLEAINIRKLFTDEKKMPVDIARILRDTVEKYYFDDSGHVSLDKPKEKPNKGDKQGSLKELVDIVEEFNRDIPYVLLNENARKAKVPLAKFVESALFLFRMLVRSVLHPKALESLLNEGRISAKILRIFLDRVKYMYMEALIDPGTAVGNIAAQCFSEPLTQYMLDAHTRSQAGGTSKSSMQTVKEVLGARSVDKLGSPVMILPVRAEFSSDKDKVQYIANNIEMMEFKRFILSHHLFLERFGEPKHPFYAKEKEDIDKFVKNNPLMAVPHDLVKRCLRIVLNKTTLILKNMSIEHIVRKLYENYKDIYIVYTPENAEDVVIRIYFRSTLFKEMAQLSELIKVREQILSTNLRGINNITNVEVIKLVRSMIAEDGSIVSNPNYWAIRTMGTNLSEALLFPDLDHYNIQTTAIKEVEAIFGIGADRNRIITELGNLGMDSADRHLMLYSDEMTHSGSVTSIERSGLKARDPKSILLRMGFSSPISTLEEATLNNSVDEIDGGITSSFLVGSTPRVGTKYNQVCFNEEFIKKNVKSAEGMLLALL